MRLFLLALLCWCGVSPVWSQVCQRKSALFQFDQHVKPRNFTEKLGNHPQFQFLQYDSGVTTRALFIQAAKDPKSRKNFPKEFKVFDQLLKETGFARGYKDLKAANVENLFINPGTIGNLGYFNKESGYVYVKLNPAGEGVDGVGAWKITGPYGCSFYILHTCGNAFFANDPNQGGGTGCCRDITFKARTDTLETGGKPHTRPFHVTINLYQGMLVKGKKNQYDTFVRLVRSIDTTTMITDSVARPAKIYGKEEIDQQVLCKDTTFFLKLTLASDTGSKPDSLKYVMNDTSWIKRFDDKKDDCHKKWELALDGGESFNSIPRFDNTTEHSRTDGAHIAAELAFSRIFNHWFQAGLSASCIQLSYQDDLPYAGSAANTYNTVYVGKPMIPVQLFGKATIGGPLKWQANISLSAGYSFVKGGKIENSGNTLATKPGTKGGLTAGYKMGVAYFFSCKFGLALSFDGQYFNNKASTMNYHLFALPITLGLRFRF